MPKKMKHAKIFIILVLGILAVILPSTVHAEKSAKASTSSGKKGDDSDTLPYYVEENEDSLIEENPDYEYDSDDDDDDDDDDDASSDEEEEEEEEEKASGEKKSKAAVNSALSQKGKMKKFPRKVMAFVKKNRIQITMALALVAFRREIGRFVLDKVAPAVVDPETGKVIGRRSIQWEPTQILKILVFIDIVRQLQAAGKSKRDPLMIALLLLVAKNPVLSSIITKTLLQENSSFVPPTEQHYTFERLNDRYEKDGWALQKAARHKKKKDPGAPPLSMLSNLRDKVTKKYSETVIVLDLVNINKSHNRIDTLRDEVSFLIHQHREKIIPYSDTDDDDEEIGLEVLVLLESPGGVAADFALASQQLLRLRKEHGIRVTVCVDRVAASGGYMIACASTPGRLYAAPFAVVGSIGVIGQTINVQKLLEGWGVQGLVFKAGKDKSPGGLIGDVSKREKKSIQSMVDETHASFKRHVSEARPRLAKKIESVATGKIWLGYDALKEGLIDRIVTSDEYIRERMEDGARVLKLIKNTRKRSLFGGSPHTPGSLDSRLLSLKAEAKRALTYLAERINIPLEELDDMASMSSRLPHSATVSATGDTSLNSVTAPHL